MNLSFNDNESGESVLILVTPAQRQKLQAYAKRREQSALVRAAIDLLFALAGAGDIGEAADSIVVSCESMADLDNFTKNLYRLGRELINRAEACKVEEEK